MDDAKYIRMMYDDFDQYKLSLGKKKNRKTKNSRCHVCNQTTKPSIFFLNILNFT